MSKEKRRVPKLRFPGFTEDWEQRKLESILIEYTEKNPGNENLPVLTSSRQGLTKQEDHFGSVQRHDISDYNVIPLGFCTYRNRSDDKTFTFNINRIVPRGLVSKFYPVFEIKNGNADFITEYLNNNTEIIKSLAINAVGTSQVVLSLRTLRNIEITLPLKAEQVAIGNLMRKLDIYITLHQRKLEHLKLKKKALLQKLFPKNGERYPELRFPGFTDAWEQRKLGDIATITGGGTPSTNISEYWNGDIDWYSPVEIGENRYVSGSIRKITKLGLEKSSAKILPIGTVLFTSRAGIGNTAILQTEGCTNQGFQSITPNSKELDTYFLYTMTPKLKRYGEVTGAGSTFVEVSGKQMEQMNLMIPSLEEQERVSQLFKVMDDAITLHQRKLEHLQLQKKALLQQMFV